MLELIFADNIALIFFTITENVYSLNTVYTFVVTILAKNTL
jgi:hypothetical protein